MRGAVLALLHLSLRVLVIPYNNNGVLILPAPEEIYQPTNLVQRIMQGSMAQGGHGLKPESALRLELSAIWDIPCTFQCCERCASSAREAEWR